MDEIRSLSVRIRSAEAYAADLRSAADRAHRLAETATWIEAASPVESQRLREDAIRARQRADIAARKAAALLERGIDSANEIVMALARRDRVVAGAIDGLLQNRVRLRPRDRTASGSVVAHDRSWATLRFQATAETIRSHVYALAEAVRRIESVPWQDRTWWESMALVDLTEKAELHRRFLSPDRQILEWDPDGDGRIVEVFGNLTTANHIAVVVPGISNTMENFDDHLARNAKDLWTAASTADERIAVIAWLGYDTPEVLNAMSKSRALEHEASLRSFVAALPSDAHVTIVAHSYGTVLAAEAALRGLPADDLVLLGSPGTRLEHASDAALAPGAQVFAGVSNSDWIVGRTGYGSVVCPEKAFGIGWLTGLRWVISPVTGPLSWVTDSCNTDADGDVKGLSHGINPAHDDFGAFEISTEDVDGHSSYFDPGTSTLEDIARIVTGTHPTQR